MAMSRASNPKQYHRDPGADDKKKQQEAEERRKDKEFADKYLKCGGKVHKKMAKGGKCSCDGIAIRGKTKARRRA
jgi:hypothetical protein